MLQDHATAALERNLATNLNDLGVQLLQRALLACNDEVAALNKISRVEMIQRNLQIDGAILNASKFSNEKYLESLSNLQHALEDMNHKIDQVNSSNSS